MQECDHDAEQERQSLHAARELVGSLVLHGKNLLAAEAIRGFEVKTTQGWIFPLGIRAICVKHKKTTHRKKLDGHCHLHRPPP